MIKIKKKRELKILTKRSLRIERDKIKIQNFLYLYLLRYFVFICE